MRILLLIAAILVGVGSALAAGPGPRGLEVFHTFANNTTPYRVLLTASTRTGGTELAKFVTVTANDSVRVVAVSPQDFLFLLAGQTAMPVTYNGKVNKYLRYDPAGVPLMLAGPLIALEIYGPAGGGTVKLNVQAEY